MPIKKMENDTFRIEGVEILDVGVHKGKTFDEGVLEGIVEAFEATKDELKPMLKLGHENTIPLRSGQPAVGWIENLRKQGTKLVADLVNVPKKIKETIEKGGFKRVSSEFVREFVDSDGVEHDRALIGTALLGAEIPEVRTLKDLNEVFSDDMKSDEELTVLESDFDLKEDTGGVEPLPELNELKEAISGLDVEDQRELIESFSSELLDDGSEGETDNDGEGTEEFSTEAREIINKQQRYIEEMKEGRRKDKVKRVKEDLIQDGRLLKKQEEKFDALVNKADNVEMFSVDGNEKDIIDLVEDLLRSGEKQVSTEEYTKGGSDEDVGELTAEQIEAEAKKLAGVEE